MYVRVIKTFDGKSMLACSCAAVSVPTSLNLHRGEIYEKLPATPPKRRRFLRGGTISPSGCSLRARYFLLTSRGRQGCPRCELHEISRVRLSSLAGRSVYSRVRRREVRGEGTLSRPVYTSARRTAEQCIAICALYGCIRAIVCMCASLGDYVATLLFQRRPATEGDSVTEGTENEIHLRVGQRVIRPTHAHARVHIHVSIPAALYRRSLFHTERRE